MELLRVITPPEPCPYLDEESACFDARYIQGIRPELYELLLQRGWRRFGFMFFRPVCKSCDKCISLRIPVALFKPNRSQRRTFAANADVEVSLGRPGVSDERFDLYDRYHADMTSRKDWPERVADRGTYHETFVAGAGAFGHELQYRIDGRLVGVALTDILPTTLSSVYCYYDPEFRSRGLGIFSILKQLELSREWGLSYQHLGYWVMQSPAMAYKCLFKPYELLLDRPEEDESPLWIPMDEAFSSEPSNRARLN